MNETNSEEPIQLSQVQEIDTKKSHSQIDVDQNPINENTDEKYNYDNLSEECKSWEFEQGEVGGF